MLKYTKLLAAMAVGVAAVHAQAVTQAQVTVSNLSYSLKDLTPNDGVSAALSSIGAQGQASVSQQAQAGWVVTQAPWGNVFDSQFDSAAYAQDIRFGATAAVVMPSASSLVEQSPAGFGRLVATASVNAGARANAGSYIHQRFELAAGTQVTFSALVSGTLSGVGTSSPLLGSFFPDHSHAFLNVTMSIDGSTVLSSLYWSGLSSFNRESDDFEQSIDGQLLTLTLKNNSASSRSYYLSLDASAWAQELTAPIPEPSTYALMALGLLGVGAATRRQRRG